MAPIRDIEKYIKSFSENIQEKLQLLRDITQKEAPSATELMTHGLIGYKRHGLVIAFGGVRDGIVFLFSEAVLIQFGDELSVYTQRNKGIKILLAEPIPVELISKIVAFSHKKNFAEFEAKKNAQSFLSLVSYPIKRTLEKNGITTLNKLAKYTEEELIKMKGVGPAPIAVLRLALHSKNLSFRPPVISEKLTETPVETELPEETA